ncbi:tripartite tricarboxylate transporter TctB family protein [Pararhizobium sp. YC-54]|uniref:tripartite tricarboxylate transporter TctB family protein n=1 Tax=Pararhizobium sp. YC-54 TaxID=2986920 RepID=UPI0021F72BE7|nr:tripartite tricarboxylate transporter TctB family protein [Pararhizobium sp. YC-54]MCW0001534.1 tripartite tricarboxylate transporter TctB family protein [Pararhizobium sp. YC-54]
MFMSKDFWAGVVFAVIGATGLVQGISLERGTASHMGPGYFPMMLCLAMLAIASVLIVRSAVVRYQDRLSLTGIWPLILICLSIIAFALLLEPAGMVIAMPVAVLIAGCACLDSRRSEVLASAIGLTVFCIAVFRYGLELPIPVLPNF